MFIYTQRVFVKYITYVMQCHLYMGSVRQTLCYDGASRDREEHQVM